MKSPGMLQSNPTDAPKHASKVEAPETQPKPRDAAPGSLSAWMDTLSQAFGIRLLLMLVSAQFVLKGLVLGYSGGGFDWLMAARNVPGPTMQIYSSVGFLPFAMKPIIGMLSDAFPILGYQKIPYIGVTTLIGIGGLGVIAASSTVSISTKMLVVALFCIITMVSSADLLTEAKYAERIRDCPEKGPDLITFVWLLVTSGGLVATLTLGLFLQSYEPNWIYAVCILPACLTLVPLFMNYLGERRLAPEEVAMIRKKYFDQWELVTLVFLVGGASLAMMATALLQDSLWVNLAIGLTVGFVIMAAFLILTAPIIGRMVAFCVLQHMCAFSTTGAVFYFYTNGPEAYPEGPHFSPLFYITIVGVVGSLFSMLGFTAFNLTMKHWRYHSVFMTTNIVYAFGHALSAIQFSRVNLAWGISDEVFAVSYAMIVSVSTSMLFLPSIVLLTQLCPKNVEGTMYALLAGTSNLGTQIGGVIGAAVLHSLGVTPRGEPHEGEKFENLWMAALISSFAPLVTLVLLPWMIPNAFQTERLMPEGATAVDGSPWRRWTERRQVPLSDSTYGSISG